MLDSISSQPGSYLLIFSSTQRGSIQVGRVGTLALVHGYYLYIGSAFGPGGVRARVSHHYRISQRPHWHLDYIRPLLSLRQVCYSVDAVRYEHDWATALYRKLDMQVPMPGLGASDCRCHSHFLFTPDRPEPSSILKALKQNNNKLKLSIVDQL